jgi:hypothetical protein
MKDGERNVAQRLADERDQVATKGSHRTRIQTMCSNGGGQDFASVLKNLVAGRCKATAGP